MKTFPLQSLTLTQAQQKQFALVDTICRHFPGADFLAGGDLGLAPGLNQPRVTQRVEKVLAEAFHAEAAALVQGRAPGLFAPGWLRCSNPASVCWFMMRRCIPQRRYSLSRWVLPWSGRILTASRQSRRQLRSIVPTPHWCSIRVSNRRIVTC